MAKVFFHNKYNQKEKKIIHISELLIEDEFNSLIERVEKNEILLILWHRGLKNLNYLKDFSNTEIITEKVKDGILVPLSLKEELFNHQNIYPFFLKENSDKTEIYSLKNSDFRNFDLIATSPTESGSIPSVFLKNFKKGHLLSVGFPYSKDDSKNLWKAYYNLFLSNLGNIIDFNSINKSKFWKYHISKFDTIPFLISEKNSLSINKTLNISKLKKGEKWACKNEKILLNIAHNKGRIISPPLEIVSDLIIAQSEEIKYNFIGKTIKAEPSDESFTAIYFPSPSEPSIYLYIYSKKAQEINISYKLHFKYKEPFPEFYFSKINFFKPSETLFIAHTSDKRAFFLNRYSIPPERFNVSKEIKETPTLKLELKFILKKEDNLLLQFSSLFKNEYLKKSDITKLLGSFKKKYFEESAQKKELKSLRVIQSKGEKRVNLEKVARDLTKNFFKLSNEKTIFMDPEKSITKEEFLSDLTNLVILGYEDKVREIIDDLFSYKRIPYIIYPSGEIIYDYRENEVAKLNKVALHLKTIKEEIYDNSFIYPFIRKRINTLLEFNFKGINFWNKEIENPETLYFSILNPLRTKEIIAFAPIIPFFVKYISFKNIRVGNHLFDFSYKRKNKLISLEFKNNTKESFKILFFPIFMKNPKETIIELNKRAKLQMELDRKYLIYSEHFEFSTPPKLEENDEKLKVNFKEKEEEKIIYLALEIYDTSIKKLVGARLFKGKRKEEERIVIYEPQKSNYIYMYFKPQKRQKTLFERNNT